MNAWRRGGMCTALEGAERPGRMNGTFRARQEE
jgi:hypothetical protein